MSNESLIQRFSVGDCEMLERPNGQYVNVRHLRQLIDNITDDDSSIVMLAKLKQLKEALA